MPKNELLDFAMQQENWEVNIILTWSANCVTIYTNVANQNPTFVMTETILYVLVVTLSTQDNTKLLKKLKSGSKRTINWNRHLSKPELLGQNPNLNHLVEPSFQWVNILFWTWRWCTKKKQKKILSSKCRNAKLQCYDW